MAVTLADFNAGIGYWRTTGWPLDFHNNDYITLAAQNPNGNFSPPWWAATVRRLHQWKATRPVPGNDYRTLQRTSGSSATSLGCVVCSVVNSDIGAVPWQQRRPFADLVSQLKPDTSSRSTEASHPSGTHRPNCSDVRFTLLMSSRRTLADDYSVLTLNVLETPNQISGVDTDGHG